MCMIWLASLAPIISSYARELDATNCGGGSLPPGRGMLWAIIQRRHRFCERIQSPLPEQQGHQRRANFLARQQLEMRQFLPGRHMDAAVVVAREFGGPLAGPADGQNHALRAPLQIEVTKVGVGRPAARGTDPLDRGRSQRCLQRSVIGTVGRRTDAVMQQELASHSPVAR